MMNTKFFRGIFLVSLGFLLHACGIAQESEEEGATGLEPTLSSIQTNIFTPKCLPCHAPAGEGVQQTEPSPLDLSALAASFAGLVDVQSVQDGCGASIDQPCGLRVAPGAPDSSYLINKLENTGLSFATDPMPRNGTLTEEEISVIRQWIEDGALDN